MLSWLVNRKLDGFEAHYDYDATYLREILEVGVRPLSLFHKATALGMYRVGVPVAPWFAAKLVTVQREDCGPCLQLVSQMAQEAGVATAHIAAILGERLDDLPDEVALTVQFCRAVLDRDAAADALRDKMVVRFGKAGLVSVAFAILSARLYPTLKFALGHARSCSAVALDGQVLWTPAMSRSAG